MTANQLRVGRSSWFGGWWGGGLTGRCISRWGGPTASGLRSRGLSRRSGLSRRGGRFRSGGPVSRGGRCGGGRGGHRRSSRLATDEQNQRQQSEVLLHGNLPQSARVNCGELFGAVPTNFSQHTRDACSQLWSCNKREHPQRQLFPKNACDSKNDGMNCICLLAIWIRHNKGIHARLRTIDRTVKVAPNGISVQLSSPHRPKTQSNCL